MKGISKAVTRNYAYRALHMNVGGAVVRERATAGCCTGVALR